MRTYYLGTNNPQWCEYAETPLMIAMSRVLRIKRAYAATTPVFLDSNGFMQLREKGRWEHSAKEHAERARYCIDRIPTIQYVSPQDCMCEPFIIAKTGKSVARHQAETVDNFCELISIDSSIPWTPVIQGFTLAEYARCIDMYSNAGIDLRTYPLVGIGSVCRRQATDDIAEILRTISGYGIRCHAFGVKVMGLEKYAHSIESADSCAWSIDGRYSPPLQGHTHKNCANCYDYAMRWYHNSIEAHVC